MGSFILSLPIPLLLAALGFTIAMCAHVVKTGQDTFWLWIIIMSPPLGGLAYLAIIVIPGLFRGAGARKVAEKSREALDPMREYRSAKAALDLAPTVHNAMKLAEASMDLGRFDEAESLYRGAMQGVHAEDPALQLGLANALIELNRPAEALDLLQALERAGESTAPATLAFARAYQGLGRMQEADHAYRIAVQRTAGLEAIARHAAFLRAIGRKSEADDLLAEIDRRVDRAIGPFRKEARAWRDLAARG